MENKKYNGFASEEQYLAVKQAIVDATTDLKIEDVEVSFDKDYLIIRVEIGCVSFELCGEYMFAIDCEDAEIGDIQMLNDIYESIIDIWAAFEQYQPKEQSV